MPLSCTSGGSQQANASQQHLLRDACKLAPKMLMTSQLGWQDSNPPYGVRMQVCTAASVLHTYASS